MTKPTPADWSEGIIPDQNNLGGHFMLRYRKDADLFEITVADRWQVRETKILVDATGLGLIRDLINLLLEYEKPK